MAWYDRFLRKEEDVEKLNPIQQYLGQATETSREYTQNYERYYETLEIVNRGVNIIVDDVAEIPHNVGASVGHHASIVKGIKKSRVSLLLNREPNPFQDVSAFKLSLIHI